MVNAYITWVKEMEDLVFGLVLTWDSKLQSAITLSRMCSRTVAPS